MVIDLDKLRRKGKTDEYIGARVSEELKETFEKACKEENISVSKLITALVEAWLKDRETKRDASKPE